jgi:hypothetical protein
MIRAPVPASSSTSPSRHGVQPMHPLMCAFRSHKLGSAPSSQPAARTSRTSSSWSTSKTGPVIARLLRSAFQRFGQLVHQARLASEANRSPHRLIEKCDDRSVVADVDRFAGVRPPPCSLLRTSYRNRDAGHAKILRAECRLLTNRAEQQSAASRSAKEGRGP